MLVDGHAVDELLRAKMHRERHDAKTVLHALGHVDRRIHNDLNTHAFPPLLFVAGGSVARGLLMGINPFQILAHERHAELTDDVDVCRSASLRPSDAASTMRMIFSPIARPTALPRSVRRSGLL